jgi:quercetin dioxygenase-like cupin family protein
MSVSLLRGSNLTAMEIHQFAGSETSKHIHTGRHEWIGVIYGCIKVVFDDDGAEVTLKDYDTCHVSPDRPHYVVAIEDSLAWTVTVPPDEHIPTEKSQETKDVA